MVGVPRVLRGHSQGSGNLPLPHLVRLSRVSQAREFNGSACCSRGLVGIGRDDPGARRPYYQGAPRWVNVDAFFTTVYVDDYLLIRVQHTDDDRSALMGSVPLDSHYVPLFGPREEGVTAILTLKRSTD